VIALKLVEVTLNRLDCFTMNRLSCFLMRIEQYFRQALPVSFLRRVVGIVLFLIVLAGLIVAVQTVPEWQVKRANVRSAVINPEAKTMPGDVANLQNEMRKTFLQVAGGAFALLALYLTFRRVKVAEQGHITDRYTKAIEQLGAMKAENRPNVEVRLGAIYALERIAQDSPRDHWTIMEVLTAYVRQNAPKPLNTPTKTQNRDAIAKGPATEIQAILDVLGRRHRDLWRERKRQRLDLRYCDLRGAKFYRANMERALFIGSNMEGAVFFWANMAGAYFDGTVLEGARLAWAQLEEANFHGARLGGVDFYGAEMEGARFFDAVGLSVEQIKSTYGWESAEFNDEFLRQLNSVKG
jgi:hypothetical protein